MDRVDDDDPEPLVLDLLGDQLPPLVEVRRWAATALADLDDEHLQAVLLVATELVTNAYDHAPGPLRVRVRHRRKPCQVRVEVDDGSPEQPQPGRSRLSEFRGRGMLMVAGLSNRWGTDPLPEGGKTVWALVSCDGDGWTACAAARHR